MNYTAHEKRDAEKVLEPGVEGTEWRREEIK